MTNKIIATVAVPENLTLESFISIMKTLWDNANTAYRNIYDTVAVPNSTAYHKKYAVESLDRAEKAAREFAEKKWKTEKKRNEYVTHKIAERKSELDAWKPTEFRPLGYVDFDVNPGSNGISGRCVLSEFSDKELEECWNEIKNNKYFKSATEFSVGYTDSTGKWYAYYDGLCHFRPQIYMTMPEDMTAAFKKEAEDLAEDIRKFYEGTHYWGD